MGEKLNTGQLIVKVLKNEGVDCIFTLNGGHIMNILYACRREGVKVVDVRHEANAAFAADAYARVTGKPGVVVTTAGPGVTNTATSMLETRCTAAPVIHIGGAAPIKEEETGTLQAINSVELMSTLCKWSKKLSHGYRAPEYVSIAFRQAMSGTVGPVYLEVPSDVMSEEYDVDTIYFPEKYRTKEMPYGSPEAIKEAAELLANARKPLLIIGDMARYSAEDNGAVKKLVDHLKMPVWITNGAKGLFADEDEPLFKMGFGTAIEADVILQLGVRNDFHISKGRPPVYNEKAKFIQVNVDANWIGFNAPAEVGIIGGSGPVACQIYNEVVKIAAPRADDDWYKAAEILNKEAMSIYLEGFKSDIFPMHPGRCAAEVAKFLETEGRDWTLVPDGGDGMTWFKNIAKAHRPGQMVEKGPLGTIGSGMGLALGAWAANGKPVLIYTGDGSFGFYSMELDTYARFKVPLVCVIANDSAWGMIKKAETIRHPEEEPFVVDLAEMRRYDFMPAMWGGKGFLCTKPEEIIPAIREIYKSGLPGIVNVQIDKEPMSVVTRGYAYGLSKKK